MIKGTITYRDAPHMKKKAFNALLKEALKAPLMLWVHKMLPEHFTPAAKRRYRYDPRSRGYTAKKREKRGHGKPLVFGGRLERELRRMYRIHTTSKRARLTMQGPFYLGVKTKKHKAPGPPVDKKAELVKITQTEVRELAQALDRAMTRALNRPSGKVERVRF